MIEFVPSFKKAFALARKEKPRFMFFYGGRGGGRSFNISLFLIHLVSRYKQDILVMRETNKSQKDSTFKELEDKIIALNSETMFRKNIANGALQIENLRTRSKITFYSGSERIKSYSGYNICWIEEADQVKERNFIALENTIRSEKSIIMLSHNRPFEGKASWLWERFYKHINLKSGEPQAVTIDGLKCVFLQTNYTENPYCSNIIKDNAEAYKRLDYNMYLQTFEGDWEAENASVVLKITNDNIFKNLNDYFLSGGPENNGYYFMGVDVGSNDADAIALCYYNYRTKQIFLVEEFVRREQTIHQLQMVLMSFDKKYKVRFIVMDSGGGGKKIMESFNFDKSLSVKIIAANKEEKYTYMRYLQSAMAYNKVMLFNGSRLQKDCHFLQYDEKDKKKISSKYHSDIYDAFLYAFRACLKAQGGYANLYKESINNEANTRTAFDIRNSFLGLK